MDLLEQGKQKGLITISEDGSRITYTYQNKTRNFNNPEEKVQAEQKALKVQNETIQKEEEAKQQVIAAQAEAESIKIKAEAEAEANKLISNSLTSTLVDYYRIQAWNGELPEVMGNSVNPFVSLGD